MSTLGPSSPTGLEEIDVGRASVRVAPRSDMVLSGEQSRRLLLFVVGEMIEPGEEYAAGFRIAGELFAG